MYREIRPKMEETGLDPISVTCLHHNSELVGRLWYLYQSQRRVDCTLRLGAGRRAHRLVAELFLPPEVLDILEPAVAQTPETGSQEDSLLDYVVEFMYRGTVSVQRQQLDGLLLVAEQLQFQMLANAVRSRLASSAKQVLTRAALGLPRKQRSRRRAINVSPTKQEAATAFAPKQKHIRILKVSPEGNVMAGQPPFEPSAVLVTTKKEVAQRKLVSLLTKPPMADQRIAKETVVHQVSLLKVSAIGNLSVDDPIQHIPVSPAVLPIATNVDRPTIKQPVSVPASIKQGISILKVIPGDPIRQTSVGTASVSIPSNMDLLTEKGTVGLPIPMENQISVLTVLPAGMLVVAQPAREPIIAEVPKMADGAHSTSTARSSNLGLVDHGYSQKVSRWRKRAPLRCEFCPYENCQKFNMMLHMAHHHPEGYMMISNRPGEDKATDAVQEHGQVSATTGFGPTTVETTDSENVTQEPPVGNPGGKRKAGMATDAVAPVKKIRRWTASRSKEYRMAWLQTQPLLRCEYCEYETRRRSHFKLHVARHETETNSSLAAQELATAVLSVENEGTPAALEKQSTDMGSIVPEASAAYGRPAGRFGTRKSSATILAASRAYQAAYRKRLPMLQCDHCPYQTRQRDNFEMHMELHHPGVKFVLVTDGATRRKTTRPIAARLENRRAKQKDWRRRQPLLQCEYCPYQIRQKDRFKRHLEKHTPESQALFTYAEDGTPVRKEGLGEEEKAILAAWQERRPLRQCQHCPYQSRSMKGLKIHEAKHDPENSPVFPCRSCFATCFSAEALEKHYQTRHEGQPPSDHYCPHCSFSTQFFRTLRSHLHTNHSFDENGELIPYHFQCSECPYTCATKYKMKVHQRERHSGEKPFGCSECDYSTARKGDLTKHIQLMHTNERPYMCETCGHKAALPSVLLIHQRVHTGEKPHVCGTCQKAYVNKRSLKKHMLRQRHSDGQIT